VGVAECGEVGLRRDLCEWRNGDAGVGEGLFLDKLVFDKTETFGRREQWGSGILADAGEQGGVEEFVFEGDQVTVADEFGEGLLVVEGSAEDVGGHVFDGLGDAGCGVNGDVHAVAEGLQRRHPRELSASDESEGESGVKWTAFFRLFFVQHAAFKIVILQNYRICDSITELLTMNIENKLKQLKSRYEELTVALGDPGIYANQKRFAEMSKEHSDLREITALYDRWAKVRDDLAGNRALIANETDRDLIEMARDEMDELETQAEQLENDLKIKLVPSDPEDTRNAIIEIRAGTGGDEAGIFAGDLFNMYRRYADMQRWTLEILSLSEATKGGFKEIVFSLGGQGIFGKMKYESGVHRVQRVPETESQGRVHTSAATVAVLPEAEEVDIQINPADLEVDTFRATGAGGQHINKTDSAIRIRHVPSGVVVECQEERSQIKNRAKAMVMLRTKLYEEEYNKRVQERAAERKSQVSTGDRSAKIRTYNYPQGRCTDHRIGLTLYNLDDIMKGNITEIIDAIKLADNLEKLSALSEK